MLHYRHEKIVIEELLEYFDRTKNEFPHLLNPTSALEYALKLSKYADFIVGKDSRGRIMSMIAYYANNTTMAYITHVHISNEYRGLGCLPEMFKYLLSHIETLKISYIQLEVFQSNTRAIKAYTKLGFQPESKNGDKILMSYHTLK